MTRKPAVAGLFYPGDRKNLELQISEMINPQASKKKALCAISPHAGIIYSGKVAGALFSTIEMPDIYILIGPSHAYSSSLAPIMTTGVWKTPLGNVPVNESIAKLLLSKTSLIEEDSLAHESEHSLEVQLPFIQFLKPEFSIVPILISSQAKYTDLEAIGEALFSTIQDSVENILIVASTDMSHYVSQKKAKELDFLAINEILSLNASMLYTTVMRNSISMCGMKPTVTALYASKLLGAKNSELIQYQTSGDVSGNYNEVVGYAGIIIN